MQLVYTAVAAAASAVVAAVAAAVSRAIIVIAQLRFDRSIDLSIGQFS